MRKKSLFVFWSSLKNAFEPYCQKWAKNSISPISVIFFTQLENQKWFFFTKKLLFIFWPSKKNGNFRWNWVFGPFLAILPRGIFQTWPENKNRFFSHKYCFLLMVKAILVDRKTSCSTISNLFWNILLVRSTGGDLNEGCFGPSSRSTFRFCESRVWFTSLYSNFNLAHCDLYNWCKIVLLNFTTQTATLISFRIHWWFFEPEPG